MTPAKLNGQPMTDQPRWSADRIAGDAAPTPSFALASLRPELEAYTELDLATLHYHIQQSDATATDGYWHAAVNEARSALEALLRDIGRLVATATAKGASNGSGTPFSNCRKALVATGFFDARESDILHFAYGMSSAKGSHPGVTDEAWSRLSRQIVFSVTQYVLRRYGEWKRYRPTTPVPAEHPAPRTTTTFIPQLRHCLARLLNCVPRRK